MDGNKPLSSIPIPGIALALLVVGVLVLSDNPFKPTRPGVGANINASGEDVRARLWQDPFDAAEYHKKQMHSATNSSIEQDDHQICKVEIDKSNQSKNTHELTKSPSHSLENLRCQIARDVGHHNAGNANESDLHVLAIMVPGGPYAEEHESRIRTRYAAITGLSRAGYIPSLSLSAGVGTSYSKRCRTYWIYRTASRLFQAFQQE